MKATSKSDSITKVFKAWERSKEFREAIALLRKSHDIPTDGFTDVQEYMQWLRNDPFDGQAIDLPIELVRKTQPEYQSVAKHQFKEYVLFGINCADRTPIGGDDIVMDEYTWTGGDMNQPEHAWKSSGKAYAKLLIGEHATLEKARKYLDTHWHIIQGSIKSQVDKESKRRRASSMDEIHTEIRHLASQKLDTSHIKGTGPKRERYIKKHVQEKYGKELELENIRKIMSS